METAGVKGLIPFYRSFDTAELKSVYEEDSLTVEQQ